MTETAASAPTAMENKGSETPAKVAQNNSSSTWLQTKKRSDKSYPPLPLDWTRVKRRRPNGEEDDCCPAVVSPISESFLNPGQKLVQGLGVFCLHDDNPSWFQGYFFPNQGVDAGLDAPGKPWGILAVQEELDDCMKSADGGYRRCTLTVFPYPAKRKEKISGVEWTGGDMMRLNNEKITLEPDQIITGEQAVPHMEKLFQSILSKCRAGLSDGESAEVLDLIPDVALVSGPMKLVISKKTEDDEAL